MFSDGFIAVQELDETEAVLWFDPDYTILRNDRRAELRDQAREMGATELIIRDRNGVLIERWRVA